MKKYIKKFIFLGLTAVALAVGAVQKQENSKNKSENSESEQSLLQTVQGVEVAPESGGDRPASQKYIVGEYKGNIAVFEPGSSEPFRKTEISVKSLPEADQKILKSGIIAETSNELSRILEDYLS